MFHPRIVRAAALAALAFGAACTDDVATPTPMEPDFAKVHANRGQPQRLEVYTQNLYLGGDTGPLFSLDLTDPGAIQDIILATATFWASVQSSDIPSRSAEVVDEIEARMPHVVALQEAVGFATGFLNPADFSFYGGTPGPDLFKSVMDEIDARNLPYSVAVMQPTTAIALPVAPPTADGLPALAVQDRVVMLVRNDVDVMATEKGLYEERLDLGITQFVRGWGRVTFDFDGMRHHVLGTHLETQGSPREEDGVAFELRRIHNEQADELLSLANALEGQVIVVGDLNSDAEGTEEDPSWTPTYGKFMDEGFTDGWLVAAHSRNDIGLTCCTEKDLLGPPEPNQRIDFVLFRSSENAEAPKGQRRGWVNMDVIGFRPSDVTDGGLWPSDHAGLSAAMKTPIAAR
jgi:hypothetical protein